MISNAITSALLAMALAAPLAAGTLFLENFETPAISGYDQGVTPPDRWVRAGNGYGSGDHGMIDKDSGDFAAPPGNDQAYACRYTNSGITTAEGVMGPPLALGATYEVSFDVVKDASNGGVSYNVRLLAFNDGAERNDCRSSAADAPTGATELAEATGNAPANGSFATVTFTYTPTAAAPLGKDLAIQVIGAGGRAIIDNIRLRTLPNPNPGLNRVTTTPLDNEVRALTYVPLLAVFDKNIVAGSGDIIIRDLTNPLSPVDTAIPVTDPRVTISGTLLQVAAGDLLQWGKNYALLIGAGAIVDTPGGTSFAGIADETIWNFSTAAGDPLTYSVARLKEHINGNIDLTAAEIEQYKLDLDSVAYRFAESSTTISALLDLVATYDTSTNATRKGPLWVARGLPKRDAVTNDLHWTMFNVMQNIMDRIYTKGTLAAHEALLANFKFGSSSNFPGACAPPAPNTHTAVLSASYLNTFGRNTIADGPFTFARKPTGTYLAPGTVATVTVPASLVNAGYRVRVGCHSSDFGEKPDIKRLDRVTRTYEITSLQTKVANPLGGGIYIEVPWLANAGVVNVDISGAVRSPYFSAKTFHTTTPAEWLTERAHPAPWADFQTDKFMMQVPKSWISSMPDPTQLMADWDKSMDAMHDLLGYPRVRGKESLYPQVDLLLKNSVHAPGYPSVNTTYSPTGSYGGWANSHLVRGAQFSPYYEFHELGHGYFFPKFGGESESNVNLLHVAVLNRAFGKSLDEGHRTSMGGNNSYQTLDTTAMAWMCVFNFSPREVPMDTAEKAYQLKGHAKFVDIAKLYGWEKLDAFWYGMNLADDTNTAYSTSNDALLLRLSKAVGKDIRPLFHFWGIHPQNPASLAASIAAEGLLPDPAIRTRLLEYKALVPANNAAFRTFATGWWGKQPSMGGAWEQREHARQWDTTPLYGAGDQQRTDATNPGEIYNENSANDIRNRIDELIGLYFAGTLGPDPMGFAVAPDAMDATTVGMTATTATSSNGAIQYYFENTTNGNIRDWSSDPSWINTGLTTGVTYTYRVKAKDPLGETAWSATADATPRTDTFPPSPGSMVFASLPLADGISSITMAAATGTDINGVEYYFENTAGGGNDSGWQDSPSYTDIGLAPGTQYTYRVRARDKSAAQNATAWSANASATTGVPDTTAPSIVSRSPADDSLDVLVSGNLVVTFDEPIHVNTGSITLKNLSDSTQMVIDVNDASQVAVSGAVLTINPTDNLLPGKDFAVLIDANAFQDISDNGFGGILVDTSWTFKTEILPFVWTQTAGNAQAWTTGANWLAGSAPDPVAGDTVDFSSANIIATTTLTLGADRSAQLWKFGDATTASHDWIVSAGNKMVLAGTAPAIHVVNRSAILNNVVDGTAGLLKTGAGTLSLANTANTYGGGTTINGGNLTIATDGSLGPVNGSQTLGTVTVNANATINLPSSPFTFNRSFILNNGASLLPSIASAVVTVNGAVTGTGSIAPFNQSNASLTLASTANDFTGNLQLGAGIQQGTIIVNSIGDGGIVNLGTQSSTGNQYGQANFRYGTGAIVPLVLDSRQFRLGTAGGGKGVIQNDNTANSHANTITINTDLLAPLTGARVLELGGANTGNNSFAGKIIDGNGTVSLNKAGTGNWSLGNAANSFTGTITLNSTTTSAGTLSYASAAGTNPVTFLQTTGSATLSYTGASPLTMSGLITASALTTGTITLNAAGATPADTVHYSNAASLSAVSTNTGARKIVLAGGNTGDNIFNGAIANNSGTGGTATLTKNGSGTWLLTGSNTYTGATAVNTGKLFVNGDQSTASGAVSVAANATLGGTGIVGGSTTVAAGGKLEFKLGANVASHDKLELAAGKSLTFTGASVLTLTAGGVAAPGDYTLVTAPGGFGTSVPPATVSLPQNWTADPPRFVGADLKINITFTGSAATPYDSWSGGAPFEGDANHDGVKNGMAWLLGASGPNAAATGLLPTIANDDPAYFTFTYRRGDVAAANTTVAAQFGNNLGGWTTATHDGDNIIIVETNDGFEPGIDKVEVKIKRSFAGNKLFVRLLATD